MRLELGSLLENRATSAAGTLLVLILLTLLLGALVQNAESQIDNLVEEFKRMRIQRAAQKQLAEEGAAEAAAEQPSPEPPAPAALTRRQVLLPDFRAERSVETTPVETPGASLPAIESRSAVMTPPTRSEPPNRPRVADGGVLQPKIGGPSSIGVVTPGGGTEAVGVFGTGRLTETSTGGGGPTGLGGDGQSIPLIPENEVGDMPDEELDCLAQWLRAHPKVFCDNVRRKFQLDHGEGVWLTSVQTFTVREPGKEAISYDLFIALNRVSKTLKTMLVDESDNCAYVVDTRGRERAQEYSKGEARFPSEAHCYGDIFFDPVNPRSPEAERARQVFVSWWNSVEKPC